MQLYLYLVGLLRFLIFVKHCTCNLQDVKTCYTYIQSNCNIPVLKMCRYMYTVDIYIRMVHTMTTIYFKGTQSRGRYAVTYVLMNYTESGISVKGQQSGIVQHCVTSLKMPLMWLKICSYALMVANRHFYLYTWFILGESPVNAHTMIQVPYHT